MNDFKTKKILIIGFGGIGCRHAQSLLDAGYKNLTIYDVVEKNILDGLSKINYELKNINIIRNFTSSNYVPELAIIATSAEPRYELIKKLISIGVNYILAEKILLQSEKQFDKIKQLSEKNQCQIYCNFPNRYISEYINLKSELIGKNIVSISVTGGDVGMGCSGIHYLDLFEYLSNSKIIDTKSCMEKWTKMNKRGVQYIEFSGLLIATNSKDESINIYFDKRHSGPVTISVQYSDISILFSEQNCILYKSNKSRIITRSFDLIPQSKLTSQIIYDIFTNKTLLPNVQECKNIHTFLFKECFITQNKKITYDEICQIT